MKIEQMGEGLSGYVPDLPIETARRCGMQRLFLIQKISRKD